MFVVVAETSFFHSYVILELANMFVICLMEMVRNDSELFEFWHMQYVFIALMFFQNFVFILV